MNGNRARSDHPEASRRASAARSPKQAVEDPALSAVAPSAPSPEVYIDSGRYPIHQPASAETVALIGHCRAQLAEHSACVLPGFLLPDAADAARRQMLPLLAQAYYCEKTHNPYLAESDPALPRTHPRNREVVSDLGALADDQVPAGSLLRALYEWPALQAFIAAVLGLERLHPYADPLGSINVNVFQPGQQLGWHFDNADWAITLMLQPADRGGVYEYVPGSRSPGDERYDDIAAVLDGGSPRVRALAQDTGALVLFRGRYTIHRVTPVEGARPRLVAVFSYDPEPGVMLSEHNRRLFYGRTG